MMFGMLPFDRGETNLFDTFDNFTRDFFRKSNAELPAFRTDIRDSGDSYILEAELPGFRKEDISLDLKDGILTITATHSATKDLGAEDGAYIRRERRFGSFRRSFDVTGIETSGITAAYESGILAVTLPKARPAEPETQRIAIQ